MATAKQIFLTNGAVGHVFARFAVMTVKQHSINAHATIMTMAEIFAATDATKATIMTMVGVILGTHPQVTDIAVIFSKACGTLYATIAAFVRD